MSARMSGFANAQLWGGDYLFLFLDFNDCVSDRADSVRAQLDGFGARLGPKAWVVSIFERMSYNAAGGSLREALAGSIPRATR